MNVYGLRNYSAILIYVIGLTLVIIANFVLKDAHVTTFSDVITRITNGESEGMLILWACALFGILFLTVGTVMMGKSTWEDFSYPSYESNPVLNIIITLIMAVITIIFAIATSKIVMGIIILLGILWLLMSDSTSSNKHSRRRR